MAIELKTYCSAPARLEPPLCWVCCLVRCRSASAEEMQGYDAATNRTRHIAVPGGVKRLLVASEVGNGIRTELRWSSQVNRHCSLTEEVPVICVVFWLSLF